MKVVVMARGWAVLAACAALGLMSGTAAAAAPAWTTYHHDAGRSGIDPDSTSAIAPSQVWQSTPLDGTVWAEPLVYGSRVYVVTENDTVYALDISTGAIVWQTHLATPVDASQMSCGDIAPTVGITSTPVIDPSTGRIYVVADTEENDNPTTIAHQMYALNLSDGGVALSVNVDPPNAPAGDTPANQLQRPGLALDAGKVIIGYGSYGDCGIYHGWLVAVPEGGGPLQTFETDSQPGDDEGALWASGNAPAIDSSGDIWVTSSNGISSTFDFGDAVIELDSNLNVLDWWAPANWQELDLEDLDLGSSVPVLLPDGLAFEIGKAGTGYLLNDSELGGVGAAPVYQAQVCSGGSYGGGIYSGGVIYVACLDGMHALALNTGTETFAPLSGWHVYSGAVGPPILAGGLIWSVGSSAGGGNGMLYAVSPSTGGRSFSAALNAFEHFATPSAGDGLLFAANLSGLAGYYQVTAFRIANTPGATPTTEALSSSRNPVRIGKAVTFTATVGPAPDGGTVAFTNNGMAIAGCGAVRVSPVSGQATCTTSFKFPGLRSIVATYSGDFNFTSSRATLTERAALL